MKENKNIERLFQEKFKDFEVSPPHLVWENIQEKLHPKEKKRRIIPFWFKTTGIAASFVTIISIVFFNTDKDLKNNNSNNNDKAAIVTSKINNVNTNSNRNTGTSDSNTQQNVSHSSVIIEAEKKSKSNSLVNTNAANKISDSKTDSKFINNSSLQNSNPYKSNNSFVSNPKKQTDTRTFNKNKKEINGSNSEIVSNRNKSNHSLKSNAKFKNFDLSKNNLTNTEITDLINLNKVYSNKKITSNSGINGLNYDEKSIKNASQTDLNPSNRFHISNNINSNSGVTDINNFNSSNSNTISKSNNNFNDLLIENDLRNLDSNSTIVAIGRVKTDSLAVTTAIIEENPMEKLLLEKETKKVVDEKEKWSKWAVNSFVSPVFFNSFASGSPISDEFATNEKSFNTSTSFGVGIAYYINKRLAIKSGISNLNLDYDTEDIAFYSSFEDQSKIANTNIERNQNGKYLVIRSEKEVAKSAVENQILQVSQTLGNLNQSTQYIEVPVEMSYAILNKKITVALKGGMSTLFLTKNTISIVAEDGNTQIGKASNLNSIHFSSNVGLGLGYTFLKNFQFNVEPTLRYQLNTFTKNSENFSPYVIGVNTGISYKF